MLDSGNFVSGEQVVQFEQEFGTWIGCSGVAACASGTCALELILRAWEIGPGDEVIVPANTWVSDAEVVVHLGAKPVFADVDLISGQITPETVEPLVNSRTKVIIAVHMYGSAAPVYELKDLAAKSGVYLLEDCAHAIGLQVEDAKAGTIGDAAAFSFYPTKNMGAFGDAGCVISGNAEFIEKIRLLRDHGQPVRDVHVMPGITGRMDEIQAAILRKKLKLVDQWNRRRRAIALRYSEEITMNPNLRMGFVLEDESVVHLFIVYTEKREALREYLKLKGIGTAIHYPNPLPSVPAFSSGQLDAYPNSTMRSTSILSIPVFPELTDEEVSYIAACLRRFE